MKSINNIVQQIPAKAILGDRTINISAIVLDSRKVIPNTMFVAVKGTQADGHTFIAKAIEMGATAIVCEVLPSEIRKDICYIQFQNLQKIIGELASNFYDNPSRAIKIIGVTGTNGKTTCATLLHDLCTSLGYTCGLISTVKNISNNKIIEATHTTPDAISLQQLIHVMKEDGCEYIFMEVSSHAIHQHRIAGLQYTGALFTNITHDHLDYHQTFEEYIRVKKLFFDNLPNSAFAITNIDDKRGLVMLQNTQAKKCTYSLKTMANYKGKILENNLTGLVMTVNEQEVHFKMIGEFNAYNIVCVYGCAIELGFDSMEVLTHLSTLTCAEGRFDYIVSPKENILGIVDYAHTPDALLNVLATINKLRKGNEVVFTVVGCGGDRDKTKRPIMGLVASEQSDKVFITSDNPRTENPSTIIKEIEDGIPIHKRKNCISIHDRREAIKAACSIAEYGDIVLVAGKGHEKYQEINGVRTHFDDKEVLKEMFDLLEK